MQSNRYILNMWGSKRINHRKREEFDLEQLAIKQSHPRGTRLEPLKCENNVFG